MRRGPRWVLAGHTLTLLVTLFVASCSYAVLSATTETSRLAVRGTVDANAATTAYDVLVRPAGSRSAAEEASDLVQPGFLGAVEGGITREQWRTIAGLRGVEVAAPVAVVGWVLPSVSVRVDLGDVARTTEPVLLRRTTTWSYDNGASIVRGAPSLLYVTPNPVRLETPGVDGPPSAPPAHWVETRADGTEVSFSVPTSPVRLTVDEGAPALFVVSTSELVGDERRATSVDVPFPFPFVLAGVDPAAEAALTGADRAVVDGAWLSPGVPQPRTFRFSDGGEDPRTPVPVVVGDSPLLRLRADYRVERVGDAVTGRLAARGFDGSDAAALGTATGRTEQVGSFTEQDAYTALLAAMATPDDDGEYYARSAMRVNRTSPLTVAPTAGGGLTAELASGDPIGWGTPAMPIDVTESVIAPGGDDTAFREMTGHFADPGADPPALVRVGVFDADRLPGTTSLSRVPLGTFAFAAPEGADAASAAALRGRGWYPSANLSGYPQPPPLMLTTLDALGAFADPARWSAPARAGVTYAGFPPVPPAPISAVRVRVAAVSGVGELDRERVRSVAEDIAETTGLDVDVTMGSSPGPQDVTVAAGRHGRPALGLTELWVTKGVAVRLVEGVDRASVLLSVIVLAAGVLVVGDTVFATVRARRREIGTLLTLGWRGRDVAGRVAVPVVASALVAGLAGALVAFLVRLALGLDEGLAGVLLAVPVALAVAALALVWPTVSAARTPPLVAMRAPVARTGIRWSRRTASVTGLAWRSALVSPGRSAAAVGGVATATAALGSLLAVQAEFRGRAVGSLLGDAVAVQVRAPDVAAALLTLALAGVGVHHVMATEIRERRPQLATLGAVGWAPRTVTRLLVTQAMVVAAFGAVLGGLAALWFVGAVFGARTPVIVAGIALAGVVAVLVAVLVVLLPVRRVLRVPSGRLLAED